VTDFTFLNTRPAHQAEALSLLVKDIGGVVLPCPTMQIHWLTPCSNQLELVQYFDKLIFTSANAVQGWLKAYLNAELKLGLKQPRFNGKLYAIGKATKVKGEELGLQIETLSQTQFDSEHFLAHAQMQVVRGEKIAVIKGEGGRTLIEQTLSERGAQVEQINVYKRGQETFCKQQWQLFIESPLPILLITSLESWQNLTNGLLNLHDGNLSHPARGDKGLVNSGMVNQLQKVFNNLAGLVVMSERIAIKIKQSGCLTPIQVVKIQSNLGIVQAIQKVISKK